MSRTNLFPQQYGAPAAPPSPNADRYDWAPNVVNHLVCDQCHQPMSLLAPKGRTRSGIPVTVVVCRTPHCPVCRNRVKEGWNYDRQTRQFNRAF